MVTRGLAPVASARKKQNIADQVRNPYSKQVKGAQDAGQRLEPGKEHDTLSITYKATPWRHVFCVFLAGYHEALRTYMSYSRHLSTSSIFPILSSTPSTGFLAFFPPFGALELVSLAFLGFGCLFCLG